MRRLVERNVHGRFARWMRSRHWAGVCLVMPFVTVILYWLEPEPWVRVHERHHAWQAVRHGWLGFWARYLWGMRKGYRNNELEVEARKAAGQD